MKTFILTSIISLLSFSVNAQESVVKTITLSVKGNCDECKARIENAADIKGVKICTWDEVKQAVTITYRADKVTPQQIEQAIAASGHDAGSTKASQSGYNSLPACCKYRDKKCEQKK